MLHMPVCQSIVSGPERRRVLPERPCIARFSHALSAPGFCSRPRSAAADPKAVVELFTSQGCSSCVAADEYFDELSQRDDVLALSFHVDYWDYLGWRDTFGSPENTARQRDYAEVLRQPSHLHAADRRQRHDRHASAATARPSRRRSRRSSAASMSGAPCARDGTRGDRGAGACRSPAAGRRRSGSCSSRPKAEVQIAHGENAGATIDYYNVVRDDAPDRHVGRRRR